MLRNVLLVVASLVFAFAVLGTSVLKTTQPQYAFSQKSILGTASPSASVDYFLPYPGILPDSPLWTLKALRDKFWLFITRDHSKRADLLLLFADKRIGMAKALIEGGKAEIGVATAVKAEGYLEDAFAEQEKAAGRGVDTADFLEKLGMASLKHKEVLENLMGFAPEDARPVLNEVRGRAQEVYEKTVHALNEKGRPVPAPAPF